MWTGFRGAAASPRWTSAAYDTAWQVKTASPSGASRPGAGNDAAANVSSHGRTSPAEGAR